jgi:hypothetical protein
MIYFVLTLVLLVFGFVCQELMPTIRWAYGSTIQLLPTLFFCVAVTVPFPVMLGLAFFVGLFWDARHLVMVGDLVDSGEVVQELTLGYSALLFGLFGSLMQGIRPLFRRGRFELPVLMVGIAVILWMLFEYFFIILLRGEPQFTQEFWLKLGTTGLLSVLVSPLFLLLLHMLARWSRFEIRYDGLSTRKYYGR